MLNSWISCLNLLSSWGYSLVPQRPVFLLTILSFYFSSPHPTLLPEQAAAISEAFPFSFLSFSPHTDECNSSFKAHFALPLWNPSWFPHWLWCLILCLAQGSHNCEPQPGLWIFALSYSWWFTRLMASLASGLSGEQKLCFPSVFSMGDMVNHSAFYLIC